MKRQRLLLYLALGMRDVVEHAIDGALRRMTRQMELASSLADGLAELESIRDLFACCINE